MRLYLSSERLGNHVDKLIDMVKGPRVAIIENAVDDIPLHERKSYQQNVYDIRATFQEIGFDAQYLDLRDYFGNPGTLENDLQDIDLIWGCGGNVFLLRRAMHQSGLDQILPALLQRNEAAYGGWSAGICVLSPSLKGLELCDNPQVLAAGYDEGVIWDGLGVINFSVAPHYHSNHPEDKKIESVVSFFRECTIPYHALRDGDVLVINGSTQKICRRESGQENVLNQNKPKNAIPGPKLPGDF